MDEIREKWNKRWFLSKYLWQNKTFWSRRKLNWRNFSRFYSGVASSLIDFLDIWILFIFFRFFLRFFLLFQLLSSFLILIFCIFLSISTVFFSIFKTLFFCIFLNFSSELFHSKNILPSKMLQIPKLSKKRQFKFIVFHRFFSNAKFNFNQSSCW